MLRPPHTCDFLQQMELTYAYLSAAELDARLRAVAAACGGRATVLDVGASVHGRPLTAVKLSKPTSTTKERDNAGMERDHAGIERDHAGIERDDAGIEGFERDDAGIEGIERDHEEIERDDEGIEGFERDEEEIERDNAGIEGLERDHEEIERDGAGIEGLEHEDEDVERGDEKASDEDARTHLHAIRPATVRVKNAEDGAKSITRSFSTNVDVERERAPRRKRAAQRASARLSASVPRTRPAVKLVANMHRDEVVGRQLLLNLLEKMCGADGGDDDARVALVRDNIDLYLLPCMNPDGLDARQRNNANDVDLNRNFPEPSFGNADSAKGREPETAALMAWIHSQSWALSANLHGGALVANYPWDAKPADGATTTTDDATFRYLASTYANAHPTMPLGKACPGDAWAFPGGITQGWRWYDVAGGMQDYNYYYAHVMEITVEVACTKWPAESTLPSYWAEHQASLFDYVLLPLRIGITGTVVDTAGSPIAGAVVSLDEAPGWTVTTDSKGVFWRLAAPGATYTVRAAASGYHAATAGAVVTGGTNDPPVLTLALARDYTVAIAVGTVFAIVVLLALAFAAFWCWRRRSRGTKRSEAKCSSCMRRRAPADDEMSQSLAFGDADGDDL